jgi:GTP-binding protein
VIDVPLGTIVREEGTDVVIGEVVTDGERLLIAKGGRGGRGNKSYLSNLNRAPRNADPGEAGEERWLRLDLKLLADVGLLGLPNAGKSTLLSKISAARPKIADYPFTTLTPVLGMASWDDFDFVVADVPGIIEGASQGSGLGLDFLRHIERTRVLAHVIDASGLSGSDVAHDFETVSRELSAFSPALALRPRILVASKRDLVGPENDPLQTILELGKREGYPVFEISAATGQGLKELTRHLAQALQSQAREA